ncbi:hypothetical protein GGQ84_001109 [Desulfitispora alkaliphila]|uniref:DUF3189 family protein n=1 Tax=Desulfitispora alkaliphila TaxID=622674 RepID=UPI003D22F441
MNYIILGTDSLQCKLAAAFYLKKELSNELKEQIEKQAGRLIFVGADRDGNQIYCFWSKKDVQLIPKVVNSFCTIYNLENQFSFIKVSCDEQLKFTLYSLAQTLFSKLRASSLEQRIDEMKLKLLKENIKLDSLTTT